MRDECLLNGHLMRRARISPKVKSSLFANFFSLFHARLFLYFLIAGEASSVGSDLEKSPRASKKYHRADTKVTGIALVVSINISTI